MRTKATNLLKTGQNAQTTTPKLGERKGKSLAKIWSKRITEDILVKTSLTGLC